MKTCQRGMSGTSATDRMSLCVEQLQVYRAVEMGMWGHAQSIERVSMRDRSAHAAGRSLRPKRRPHIPMSTLGLPRLRGLRVCSGETVAVAQGFELHRVRDG